MAIRRLQFRGIPDTVNPSLSPLRYGQPARVLPIESVFHEADSVISNACRCLLSVGMHGADHLQILSQSVPTDDQVYPVKTRETVVARRPPQRLTPGCFPYVRGLALPSGPVTKYLIVNDKWNFDGAFGYVRIVAVYRNGVDTTTIEALLNIDPSDNPSNSESTSGAQAWANFIELGYILTDKLMYDLHSENSTVELTVYYGGSPRVIDLGIFEIPIFYRRDTATDPDEWMMPITYGSKQNPKTDPVPLPYPSVYPIEELSSTDPFYGSKLLAAVSHRQQTELGPVLLEWSAWSESDTPVTATECAGFSTTSTSYVDLFETDLLDWSADNPGWSVSSGGYAQQFNTSNHLVEMHGGRNACVPVRCWVYGSRTVSGTSTVKFQSERYSICQVLITSSTPQWWSATGHIKCGRGAGEDSVLQLIAKASAGSTLNVKHVLVEYLNV